MQGTSVYGDSTDDTQQWSIKFDTDVYDQLLFTTNNIKLWSNMPKLTFTLGIWISGLQVPNNRSSLTPLMPGTSEIYFRLNVLQDPYVSFTYWETDNVYTG